MEEFYLFSHMKTYHTETSIKKKQKNKTNKCWFTSVSTEVAVSSKIFICDTMIHLQDILIPTRMDHRVQEGFYSHIPAWLVSALFLLCLRSTALRAQVKVYCCHKMNDILTKSDQVICIATVPFKKNPIFAKQTDFNLVGGYLWQIKSSNWFFV